MSRYLIVEAGRERNLLGELKWKIENATVVSKALLENRKYI